MDLVRLLREGFSTRMGFEILRWTQGGIILSSNLRRLGQFMDSLLFSVRMGLLIKLKSPLILHGEFERICTRLLFIYQLPARMIPSR